jgi:hypothetical protein
MGGSYFRSLAGSTRRQIQDQQVERAGSPLTPHECSRWWIINWPGEKASIFSSDVSIDMIASISPLNHRGHVYFGSPILNAFFFILTAKEGAMDVLGQILEFDVARLLHHFERFVR